MSSPQRFTGSSPQLMGDHHRMGSLEGIQLFKSLETSEALHHHHASQAHHISQLDTSALSRVKEGGHAKKNSTDFDSKYAQLAQKLISNAI